MTNSQIFTKAHIIARSTVNMIGSYRNAFSMALIKVYTQLRAGVTELVKPVKEFKTLNIVTTFAGTDFQISKVVKTGTKRTFFAVEYKGKVAVRTMFARKYDAVRCARHLIATYTSKAA